MEDKIREKERERRKKEEKARYMKIWNGRQREQK